MGVIVTLAAVGGLIAIYMTLGYYHIQPFFTWFGYLMPRSCRLSDGTCVTILEDPSAHLLGLPNALFGLVYYALVIVALSTQSWLLYWIARWASVLTLLMSAYLIYVLTARLRQSCVLCYTGHLINVSLAVLLWNIPGPPS